MSNGWFFQDLMATIADQSRGLLPSYLFGPDSDESLQQLIAALMSERGEASGVAIARQILRHYRALEDEDQRSAFFRYIANQLRPDRDAILQAAAAYRAGSDDDAALSRLQAAVESPRLEFLRRLNLAPGATHEIVHMRADLLRLRANKDLPDDHARDLAAVDRDMAALLQTWFNRGFLVLRRIDWQTPAAILEKIIDYEAVHAIDGWDDLRRRLDPVDRRCFAFFHPSLIDEPLIFVEVALTGQIPDAIAPLLAQRAPETATPAKAPTTAVFYSISNCQEGLRGISFGSFLIKQVVEDLLSEHPGLKTFVTLSPVPRLANWLDRALREGGLDLSNDEAAKIAETLARPDWTDDEAARDEIAQQLAALAARYFLIERTPSGKLIDPVARFHLGNGARLERINPLGDHSPKGLRESYGVMVNYLYEPKSIPQNHQAFVTEGTIAASRPVRALVRQTAKSQAATQTDTAET